MSRLTEVFGTEHPVALVTGSGANRVGNAIVRLLASHGYNVVIHANRSLEAAEKTAQELRALPCESLVLQADLRSESQLRGLVQQTHDHFNRLDVLINSAAIWQSQPLEKITAENVREHFEVNTLATFLTCQAAGLIMRHQSHGGAIVNIGDWAVERPYLNYAAYFPSKGSIPTLTRNFAVELAAWNSKIRVNAVLPGPVMLPPELPPAERDAAIAGTLLKREGTPRHVADAVRFLIENDFITGICLPVDGGRTIA
jgi:pteridine reductase